MKAKSTLQERMASGGVIVLPPPAKKAPKAKPEPKIPKKKD